MPILFSILLIILGFEFYSYTLKSEIEDKEDKPIEKAISVGMICSGVLISILYLIYLTQ